MFGFTFRIINFNVETLVFNCYNHIAEIILSEAIALEYNSYKKVTGFALRTSCIPIVFRNVVFFSKKYSFHKIAISDLLMLMHRGFTKRRLTNLAICESKTISCFIMKKSMCGKITPTVKCMLQKRCLLKHCILT